MVKKKNKCDYMICIGLTMMAVILLLVFKSYVSIFIENTSDIPTREGNIVLISDDLLDDLNRLYAERDTEYFLCVFGKEIDGGYEVTSFVEQELRLSTDVAAGTVDFFVCQDKGAIGSLHNHLLKFKYSRGLCVPSRADIYVWGDMTDPEPKVQFIQCGVSKFFIMETPTPENPLEDLTNAEIFTSIAWQEI